VGGVKVSDAERIVAGRLLNMASEEFGNHGCNDMDMSVFESVSVQARTEMTAAFNEWNGSAGEDEIQFTHIGDWAWMAFLAARLEQCEG